MKSFVGWEIGFGLGVCFVPISIAEKGPDSASIADLSDSALCRDTLIRDLPDFDRLHWGD